MAADVANSLKSWSSTEGSNSPAGSTAISTNLDDNLRMIQKVVRDAVASTDSIASATTCDLGTKDAGTLTITGTTTITGLGTVSAGIHKKVIFDGALTLTYNGTSLILPTAANITTAAGDTAEFVSLGSGNWRCLDYQRASGLSVLNTTAFQDGTVGAPAISWVNDADTGLYRIGANSMGAAANGANVATFGATGVTIPTLASTTATITTCNATTLVSTSIGHTVNAVTLNAGSALNMVPGADPLTLQKGGTEWARIGTNGGGPSGTCFSYSSDPYALVLGTYNGNGGFHVRTTLRAVAESVFQNDTGSAVGNLITIYGENVSSNVIYIYKSGPNPIWRVDTSGATYADGAYSGSGADYAEAFLFVGEKPQPGDPVTLEGDKVRIAVEGDDIIGVVSDGACAIGDAKLLEVGGVAVGLVGKLRVNDGRPVRPEWRHLGGGRYLVK